jgi:hypothetical protein
MVGRQTGEKKRIKVELGTCQRATQKLLQSVLYPSCRSTVQLSGAVAVAKRSYGKRQPAVHAGSRKLQQSLLIPLHIIFLCPPPPLLRICLLIHIIMPSLLLRAGVFSLASIKASIQAAVAAAAQEPEAERKRRIRQLQLRWHPGGCMLLQGLQDSHACRTADLRIRQLQLRWHPCGSNGAAGLEGLFNLQD